MPAPSGRAINPRPAALHGAPNVNPPSFQERSRHGVYDVQGKSTASANGEMAGG
jgi:hypothetical protein